MGDAVESDGWIAGGADYRAQGTDEGGNGLFDLPFGFSGSSGVDGAGWTEGAQVAVDRTRSRRRSGGGSGGHGGGQQTSFICGGDDTRIVDRLTDDYFGASMRLLIWLAGGLAWAQSGGIGQPQMGVMVDGFDRARPVLGVSASVTLGDPVAEAVVASACSDSLCVLKTWNAIVVGSTKVASWPGPALIAIDGDSALLYASTGWENLCGGVRMRLSRFR